MNCDEYQQRARAAIESGTLTQEQWDEVTWAVLIHSENGALPAFDARKDVVGPKVTCPCGDEVYEQQGCGCDEWDDRKPTQQKAPYPDAPNQEGQA